VEISKKINLDAGSAAFLTYRPLGTHITFEAFENYAARSDVPKAVRWRKGMQLPDVFFGCYCGKNN